MRDAKHPGSVLDAWLDVFVLNPGYRREAGERLI